jgi:hypothetical protein
MFPMFNSVIIRRRLFNMQLFIGTTNLESQVIQLRRQLPYLPVFQSVKDKLRECSGLSSDRSGAVMQCSSTL